MTNESRFGIFLRPDPVTCWAVTQVTTALRQQFDFLAAAAFAPHATLIGNLRTTITPEQLVATLDPVFAPLAPLVVYDHGLSVGAHAIRRDINQNARGDGPNTALQRIAGDVREVVAPLHRRHHDLFAPNVDDYEFSAHLTLAGFDLNLAPHLRAEVEDFIVGLGITFPTSFVARWYSLFEFKADWNTPWWRDMPWRHITSWKAQ